MTQMNERMNAAAKLIRSARSVVLACHVGPDGDALGSMLGMAVALRRAGKEVYPSFGEPFSHMDVFRFLPVDMLVSPAGVPAEPELMMSFDAGSIDRLGELASQASRAGGLIVLDHHVTNVGFGTVDLIDGDAAATAVMVMKLLDELDWPLDPVIAECLLTGIVTDTGRYQYSNTTPETLAMASRLVAAGARPERISRHVYEESPFGFLKATGEVLRRAVLEAELAFVWSYLSLADLEAAEIGPGDTDPLIDILRIARESDVAALAKETPDGRIKMSLRSRGRVDVGSIASALGGGGHHNAAGFTYDGTVEEAVAEVRVRL